MDFLTFIIGFGGCFLLLTPLLIWYSKREDDFSFGLSKSMHRHKKRKQERKPDNKEQDKKQSDYEYLLDTPTNPSDVQYGLSFNAKMNIFLPISIFSSIPLYTAAIALSYKICKENGLMDNIFGVSIIVILFLNLTLVVILYIVVGVRLEKRLPRYSAKGKVTKKELVWNCDGKRSHQYCVLSVLLETNDVSLEFYIPQKLYYKAWKNDSVSIVYHYLSSKEVLIDEIKNNTAIRR